MQQSKAIDAEQSVYTIKKSSRRGHFIEIDEYDDMPVFASVTCYIIANLYRPLVRQLMILEAIRAMGKAGMHDASEERIRILHIGRARDYETLWVVWDERGITFMFPEDY